MIRYCKINKHDIANGTGIRTTLFVSGCTHHCPGCFQPETWSFDYGELLTLEVEDKLIEMLSDPVVEGLTVLGGEPMEPVNQKGLLPLLRRVWEIRPVKNVWVYSGYTWEEITNGRAHCEFTDKILGLIDVLVDGPFIEAQKDISLRFRGSSNQRVIDVRASLESDTVVLFK